jgi:predicted HTH domain antitoxin
VSLVIPDEIVQATHLSPAELRVEIAVLLFRERRLTLGQAARFAEIPQPDFQRLLGRRRIPLHYGVEQLEEDLKTIREQPSR